MAVQLETTQQTQSNPEPTPSTPSAPQPAPKWGIDQRTAAYGLLGVITVGIVVLAGIKAIDTSVLSTTIGALVGIVGRDLVGQSKAGSANLAMFVGGGALLGHLVLGVSGCAWWQDHREPVLTLSPVVCAQIAVQHDREDLVPLCHEGGDLARVIDRILTEIPQCHLPPLTAVETPADAGAGD